MCLGLMDNKRIVYGAAGAALGFYFVGSLLGVNPTWSAVGVGLAAYNWGPEMIGI
jgi:hypothetical protein